MLFLSDVKDFFYQHANRRFLKTRHDIGIIDVPACGAFVVHIARDGGFQAAETEIRVAGMQERAGKFDGVRVAGFRHAINHRAAGKAESEKFCDFIVGFSDCIVHRRTENLVARRRRDAHNQRMPAGNGQRNVRRGKVGMIQKIRIDMPQQMIHADERLLMAIRERFRGAQPDQQ